MALFRPILHFLADRVRGATRLSACNGDGVLEGRRGVDEVFLKRSQSFQDARKGVFGGIAELRMRSR